MATFSRSGSSIPLDGAALYNMVAFDNRRRKFRLTLGELQGPTKNQLVIALSSALPRQILDRSFPTSQRRPAPSPSAPLALPNIPPFGVYFCRKPTLTALRRFFVCRCRTRLKLWRSSIRFVLIDYSHIWENKWDKYLGVTIKHKKQDSKTQNNHDRTTQRTQKDT